MAGLVDHHPTISLYIRYGCQFFKNDCGKYIPMTEKMIHLERETNRPEVFTQARRPDMGASDGVTLLRDQDAFELPNHCVETETPLNQKMNKYDRWQ